MKFVNIGCGSVFHPAWCNLDFSPASPAVRACDLRRGLPFAAGEVDVVYHSHVLEHLDAEEGAAFLRECYRVLRPGGIIRVAVPDLEQLVRAYIALLDERSGPDPVLHEWLRLELFDQFSREHSGGRTLAFLRALAPEHRARVRARVGLDFDRLATPESGRPRRPLLERLRAAGWRGLLARSRRAIAAGLVRVVAGSAAATAFSAGIFRAGGEVHRVAYDRFVLERALRGAGFTGVRVMAAGESSIPDFASYGLELLQDRVRKPDSLFVEARRTG